MTARGIDWTVPLAGPGGINDIVANLSGVQGEMDQILADALGHASSELAAHHHDGHAQVEVEKWGPDRALILSDERGQAAAMTIEFGRHRPKNQMGEKQSQSKGLFILRNALRYKRKKR